MSLPPLPDTPDLLVEEPEPGLAWITIHRPHKHNALARPVLAQLKAAVTAAGGHATTRLVIITGAGDKYFAAGGDLRELDQVRDEASVHAMMDEAGGALDAVRNCPVPVVAFLNGHAIGGGAELAVACDLRMQARHARIGFIQSRLAITSAWGGGPDLFRLVGPARATRMMARAEMVDAPQALAWGLADAVVGGDPRGEDVADFLRPMLACTPIVMRGIKAQAIASRRTGDCAAHRAVEREHLARAWLHEDHWVATAGLLPAAGK